MFGGNVNFDFATLGAYTAPDGLELTLDLTAAGYIAPFGGGLVFDFNTLPSYTAPNGLELLYQFGFADGGGGGNDDAVAGTYVTFGTDISWKPSFNIGVSIDVSYEAGTNLSNVNKSTYGNNSHRLYIDFLIDIASRLDIGNTSTKLDTSSVYLDQNKGVSSLMVWEELKNAQVSYSVNSSYHFDQSDTDYSTPYKTTKPIESDWSADYSGLNGFDELTSLYLFNFGQRPEQSNIDSQIKWGYGLNNFLVGGSTNIPSNPAPDVIDPPNGGVIEHINYEVYRVVNIVNIKVKPSNTAIMFSDFNIQRDVESFAWTISFTALDKTGFDLVKPNGRVLKTIDVEINGEVFTMVVAKASIQRTQGVAVYKCSGWSQTKLLADPYSTKRSYKDNQARTAAQIIDMELTGTGFTYTWSTVDWLIPIGVHSYQNKTPLGAIIEVANAVGAVIAPDITQKRFDIRPYYPISPWQWDSAPVNRTMNERQFFETSSETVPKENPDGVYVYGEENGGVAVKAVRNGLPGTSLLPDIVNKYITHNTAGQERGRVEVCKNSFIERIPMTTYVDENGIIMPHELIEFTDLDDLEWKGMVLSTSVDCKRVGTALTQNITVARFYDND